MPLLDALLTYIDAQTALTAGSDLFASEMPGVPDACVAVYEYPGERPEHAFGANSAPHQEKPRFQVVCRNAAGEYDLARSQAETIFQLLDKVTSTTLSGTVYHRIAALQSPFAMAPDENGRPRVACNFATRKALG